MSGRVTFLITLLALLLFPVVTRAYVAPVTKAPRPLEYPDDTFAFKNETVWNYVGGSVEPEQDKTHVREYTRRCFVLSRAIVQFWKFATFDPQFKPLPADELAEASMLLSAVPSMWLIVFARGLIPVVPVPVMLLATEFFRTLPVPLGGKPVVLSRRPFLGRVDAAPC